MNTRRQGEARNIGEQAAEWLLVLEEAQSDPKTLEAFTAWTLESPLHVDAFLRAATMDSLLNGVDSGHVLQIDRKAFDAELPDIVPAADAAHMKAVQRRKPLAHKYWLAAACVTLVAATSILVWRTLPFSSSGWTHYSTAIGEQRVIELDDGSVLHMNTGSRVDVSFVENERRLRLLAGEAMFRVKLDPSRPFRVYSDATVIQALGTTFNVRQRTQGAEVSVLEGIVQVTRDTATVRLSVGEQVRVATNGAVTPPAAIDVNRVGAWRQRRLIFVNEPLSTIAEEFNRYNRTPKIRIEGEAAAARRYAAAFDADDPESLLTVLAKDPKLQIKESREELLIRSR